MKVFNNLAAFAVEIAASEAGVVFQLEKGLEAVAVKVEKTAKEEIGEYQAAVGPFPAWEELADSTKADRIRQGYMENDPLLRSGELRDSISHQTEGLEAAVGSNSDVAVYQELGTDKMPPRPFLGPAAEHNREAIRKIVGGAVIKGLLGSGPIPTEFDYDHEV